MQENREEVRQIRDWGNFYILVNIFIFQALPVLFYNNAIWLSLDVITRIFSYICILQILLVGFIYLHNTYLTSNNNSRKLLSRYYVTQFSLLCVLVISYILTERISDSFKFLVQLGMVIYMTLGIVGLAWYLISFIVDYFSNINKSKRVR